MKLTFLGTGTSTGVPQIRCTCPVCTSSDPRDNRLRCAAMIETHGKRLLIDCGPDFREQMLRFQKPEDGIDALLVTHSHYDHTGGIDDLRPYYGDHAQGFPIYCSEDVAGDLATRLPYCFPARHYPGAPILHLNIIESGQSFLIGDVESKNAPAIYPFRVMHGKLPILGFRIGNLTYITDCKTLPDESLNAIAGKTDTLVINALFDNRTLDREHPTHMNLTQALDLIEKIRPRRTFLIHMGHRIGLHHATVATLPPSVTLAYDGLTVEIPE